MRKRLISMLLLVCITFSMIPTAAFATEGEFQNPFDDVSKTDWFYDSVMYVIQNKIFDGTGDKTFSPKKTMTRGMFITVLGRMAKVEPASAADIGFSDVPMDAYFAPYVAWAVENKIAGGTGNGKFSPDLPITREQVAVLLVNYYNTFKIPYKGNTSVSTSPKDILKVSSWAKDAVSKLWAVGMFNGNSSGNFNPQNHILRSEAAAISMRSNEVILNYRENKKESNDKPTINSNSKTLRTITFMDDGQVVAKRQVIHNEPLSDTPTTSKEGYTFRGWYTESGEPFYAEDPVTKDQAVYAKYEQMAPKEQLTLNAFTKQDQSPELSFAIRSKSPMTTQQVKDMISLEIVDGTDPVELAVTGEGETFTVSAVGGFLKGSSYKLTLEDDLYFADKDESVRTANFTIKKEEVSNLTLKEDMVYLQDTADMRYTLNDGKTVDVLESAVLSSETKEKISGTFEYTGTVSTGDTLCIYENTDPRTRDVINKDYTEDSVAYIKVTGVSGKTVSFTSLDEGNAKDVIFMPDTLPFFIDSLPTGETGTVESNRYDSAAWTGMGMTGAPQVDVGDFVVFYIGAFEDITEESTVYYGEVTQISNGIITYKKSSLQAMEACMDMFTKNSMPGDVMLDGVNTQALENQIEKQVRASGFADEAANYLAKTAVLTNGFQDGSGLANVMSDENRNLSFPREFRNINGRMELSDAFQDANLTNVVMMDEKGAPISPQMLRGFSAGLELTDNVKITVEIDKSSKYFKDGIRLALGIEAEFSVDAGNDGELKILLNATFMEEIAIDINVNANAKWKWYAFIPVLKDITMSTSVDLKNYTAISIDVKAYTKEKDTESDWDWAEFKKLKEVFDKIQNLKEKIEQFKDDAEKVKGYMEDIKALTNTVSSKDEVTFKDLAKTFGEMNVTEELKELLHITDETKLDAGVKNLMERYSEMLQNESDWVELLNKEIFYQDINPDGCGIIMIGIGADFIIKGNINIALGANMEYVVGKRYSFWFSVFSRTSGSSQMDILDERFAFQFYVMGMIGLRMGVEAEFCIGLFSTKLDSVGITAEFGPYVELYGYFVYEYSKLRPQNTNAWQYNEKMLGALFLEFGLYLEMTFKAQIGDGALKYEPTLMDRKYPLLTAGVRRNVYDYGYKLDNGEIVLVQDEDGNSQNGVSMKIPDSYLTMSYMDLKFGNLNRDIYPANKFYYTLSNRNFSVDENTGTISVNVPNGVKYMECDLTLTWKTDKLAFSKHDLTITLPLVWTSLSTSELKQRFTASVRVGNKNDGYTTIWSNRVNKGANFDLPTEDEILKLLNYHNFDSASGNLKYSGYTGYTNKNITGLTISSDTQYYFDVTPRTYTLTVNNVQNADGSKVKKTFNAKYGDAYDLTELQNSGTNNDESRTYTAYLKTTAADGKRDITAAIDRFFAEELLDGKNTYSADYIDNSVLVTYQFDGIDLEDMTIKIKKGTMPPDIYSDNLTLMHALVSSWNPAIAPVNTATNFTAVCKLSTEELYTITYESNGGSKIEPQKRYVGATLSTPNIPTKNGYTFDGWYSDAAFSTPFNFSTMPNHDITVYAKWKGSEKTINFDANEGQLKPGEERKTVSFGDKYGSLPTPTRSGYAFDGWFTSRTEGEKITSENVVNSNANQTLYAHWTTKQVINKNIITFAPNQSAIYDKNAHAFVFQSGDLTGFTVEYKRQVLDNEWSNEAIQAGTYDIKITRPEDAQYVSFEHTISAGYVISKATRTVNAPTLIDGSISFASLQVAGAADDNRGKIEYAATTGDQAPDTGWGTSNVSGLEPNTSYNIFARVTGDANYEDAFSSTYLTVSTSGAPSGNWNGFVDQDWMNAYSDSINEYTISTPEQLAALSKLAATGKNFVGKTFKLTEDIDLKAHQWTPIGIANDINSYFSGIFNGNGHTIRGMYAVAENAGLFNVAGGRTAEHFNGTIKACVKNLTITSSYISATNFAGAFAAGGYDFNIINCVNESPVVGSAIVAGGIVGQIEYNSSVTDCKNSGIVKSSDNTNYAGYGGIVGVNFGTVDRCVNTGNVYGGYRVGGIVGRNLHNIKNSMNEGSVSCRGWGAGGITGSNEAVIENCANSGSISGPSAIGGIVGLNDVATVENGYSIGSVSASDNYCGGVCGRNKNDDGWLKFCYYLRDSAKVNGASQEGAGNKSNDFLDSDNKHSNCVKIASANNILSTNYSYENIGNLLEALNAWVEDKGKGYCEWEKDAKTEYPRLVFTK